MTEHPERESPAVWFYQIIVLAALPTAPVGFLQRLAFI
jgi:hypothetical protein